MPEGDPRPPSYAQDRRAIWREIEALWKITRTGGAGGGKAGRNRPRPAAETWRGARAGESGLLAREDHVHPPGSREVVFSYPGAPEVGKESPGWRCVAGGQRITAVWVTATGGDATVEVLVDGDAVASASGGGPATGLLVDLPTGSVVSVRATAASVAGGTTCQVVVGPAED